MKTTVDPIKCWFGRTRIVVVCVCDLNTNPQAGGDRRNMMQLAVRVAAAVSTYDTLMLSLAVLHIPRTVPSAVPVFFSRSVPRHNAATAVAVTAAVPIWPNSRI